MIGQRTASSEANKSDVRVESEVPSPLLPMRRVQDSSLLLRADKKINSHIQQHLLLLLSAGCVQRYAPRCVQACAVLP